MNQQTLSKDDSSRAQAVAPVVLVHGAAWTRQMWLLQVRALADERRVIAVDLPGHGARRGDPFDLAIAVETLRDAVIDHAGSRACIVGLSLGGYVATAFAARYPELCMGLVLSGCCIDYRGIVGILSQMDATIAVRVLGLKRLERMQAKSVRSGFPADIGEPQVAAGFAFEVMPAVYRDLRRHDFGALLRTFAGPVLLLNGERDRPNRRAEHALLRSTRDGQLTIIPGAGHLCNLDAPSVFTDAVRQFVATVAR